MRCSALFFPGRHEPQRDGRYRRLIQSLNPQDAVQPAPRQLLECVRRDTEFHGRFPASRRSSGLFTPRPPLLSTCV